MVPGITERERMIADARRMEWLADALAGPARVTRSPVQRTHSTGDRALPPLLQRRRAYPSVQDLQHLVQKARQKLTSSFPERATAK